MASSHFVDTLLARAARTHAEWQFGRFMRAARRARAGQDALLLRWLNRHADSELGRKLGLSRIRSYTEFASRVPIHTYEDLRPYIVRVMEGDRRAIFGPGQRVLMFATTSGTTDAPKFIPVTPRFLREYRRGWNVFGLKALLDHPDAVLRPILQVASPADGQRTPCGLPCGSISGLLAATQKRLVRRHYLIPPAVAQIEDAEARYYTMMRLAVPRDVSWIVTASPATPLKLARTAAVHAERLVRDVRDGTLNPPGDVPGRIRQMLEARLDPAPADATRLARIAENHGALLPRHYWQLSFLANWTGGTLGLHVSEFPPYFGESPVRDIGLLSTEGRISIPLQDGTPAGVLDAAGSFLEFIDGATEPDRPLGPDCVSRCHELTVGRDYRVVMTTWSGLVRYDLGDYVRVHGFCGQAPIVEFLHRGAHVSSLTGEKLTEWQVTQAFAQVCRAEGVTAGSFVCAPVWDDPPYYRLYVDRGVADVEGLGERLDAALVRLNIEYASKRSSARLRGVTVCRLKPGTLSGVDARSVNPAAGAANEQFKHKFLYTRPGEDAALLPHLLEKAPA